MRAAALCAVLTLLIFVLQLLRALDRLPGATLAPSLLAELARHTAPALLTLTAPMALLVATGLTLGERALDGELRGWAALGLRASRLVRGPATLAVALAVVACPLAGWLAPHALARATETLEHAAHAAALDGLAQHRARHLGDGHWLAATPSLERTDDGDDTLVLDAVLWLDASRGRRLDARRATLHQTGADRLVLQDATLTLAAQHPDQPCTHIQAARVATGTHIGAGQAAQGVVPHVETLDAGRLLSRARGGDALARGQLVKRLVLVALPVGLLALLAAAIVGLRVLAHPGPAILAALGFAAALHGAARGCELLARADALAGLAVAAALLAASLGSGLMWLRRS